jgi:hypothetical protein
MTAEAPSGIPALQIRCAEDGGWWLAAKWTDGQVEDIAHFDSEQQANDWIAADFQAWLDNRKKGADTASSTG